MASYNGDFNRMQEEALFRLREMQSRSRTAVNRPNIQPSPPQRSQQGTRTHQNSQQPSHAPSSAQRQAPTSTQPQFDPLKSLLGDFKIDSEKALILLILLVLYKNKSDPKLLLALGYLLI